MNPRISFNLNNEIEWKEPIKNFAIIIPIFAVAFCVLMKQQNLLLCAQMIEQMNIDWIKKKMATTTPRKCARNLHNE